MRRFAVLTFLFAAVPVCAAEPTPAATLDLWPGKAPGETKDLPPEAYIPATPKQMDVKRLGNVSKPQVSVYLPAKGKAAGGCVVIAPGGGYNILAIEHEGTEVASWLNSLGVAAAVLKYRVPRRPGQTPDNLAQLQDAQRAVGLVRSKAAEWGIDPAKVGVLGFSAGGHLMASLATHFDKRLYDRVDAADDLPCRPAFAVLVYPAYLTERGSAELKPEYKVTKETPPTFFAHASDDPVSSENSVALYRALRKAGVPAELHLFASGGHGFGMRPKGPPADWPKLCEHWLRLHGVAAAK